MYLLHTLLAWPPLVWLAGTLVILSGPFSGICLFHSAARVKRVAPGENAAAIAFPLALLIVGTVGCTIGAIVNVGAAPW